MEKVKSEIMFADEKVKNSLEKLKTSKSEDKKLFEWIERAFEDLEKDAFSGTQIPKKLFPKEYIQKYNIDNLWKYNLPNAWRLIYTIQNNKICLLSIVLEWLSHKDYEKRFRY
jgi:Txe/YoeB family toxin of Txe-Axe toxin-antitoxin module